MAIESTKRAVDRDESGQNVRAKRTAKPSSMIIVTNIEQMKLEICWTQKKIRDFQTAKLFQFLYHSERLPSINVSLVEEYIKNYDSKDGSSVVQGRIIGTDETILEKVLFLPIGEMAIGTDESSDFSPAVGTFEGMVFNWAAYVATRIHAEIGAKFKLGKFTSLLCSNYVYAVIAHTLCQPPSEEENPILVSAPLQREQNLLAQNHNAVDVIHEIGESSHTVVQGVIPVIEARRVPSGIAVEEENEVPLLIDINQLVFLEGRLSEGVSLKNAVLKHISQIHCMKFKCQLQAKVDKIELLATEKALLCNQLRCEMEKMRSEIEVLQNEVSKLMEELTVTSQSQVSIEDVPEGMSPQQHQLELRDA
uniref:Predicted protein n=1 Tax=Physcomitrium patens TaxID=3218 RepID=A9U487_PHYPA